MIDGMPNSSLFWRDRSLSREGMIQMLHAGLDSGENRFVRQAALAWLAAFPGDIEVTLLQAQAVINEGRPGQTIPGLELICRKDPFSLFAFQVLSRACFHLDDARYRHARTVCFVLGDLTVAEADLENWGKPLRTAWQLLNDGQYADAGLLVQESSRLAPVLLLAEAMQLLVSRATQNALTVNQLAQTYHDRWPDCLPVALILVETQLASGNEPEAVRLLHWCATNDPAGQVGRRLWGENHPYRWLWPGESGLYPMAIHFDLPVPAGVAARLGWNRLGPGEASQPETKAAVTASGGAGAILTAKNIEGPTPIHGSQVDSASLAAATLAAHEGKEIAESHNDAPGQEQIQAESSLPETGGQDCELSENQSTPASQASHRRTPGNDGEDSLSVNVEKEFAFLAKTLKRPDLGRADGRYPVYVILSSREGLAGQYGPQTTEVIVDELRRLAGLVRKRRGWEALAYYPDDTACTTPLGLAPVNAQDAWKLKHALADLDAALARRGEMIGAIMIVGGNEVIPFHHLPNPTDDMDGEVISDSPYTTRDSNYFVPEWPVGRLPGGGGPDAGLLLEQIRDVYRFHSRRSKQKNTFGRDWLVWLGSILRWVMPTQTKASFGYTAAVWRRSSLAAFRPIGAPHTVLASPPTASGSFDPKRLSRASLGYYNLHGLEDSPNWYGQRDPLEQGIYPEYPVALSPVDLHKNGHAPRFIFSEACYGGHIHGKGEGDSLALKFLSMGTLGVVASTCTAYGSISTPLIAADLLGNLFWRHLKAGCTAGEALLRAKVDLVREMSRRQGYLDGEDQKTLISFVLFGDPLAAYEGVPIRGKGIYRSKDHPMVRIVSDGEVEDNALAKVPERTLNQVKQVVAEYLPGADLAGMRFCRLQTNGGARESGTSGQAQKNGTGGTGRVVVTVSKQVHFAQHLHRHYLRVTLDENGQALKMALSR